MGGEGPIPLSEIAAYCSLMEVDDKEAMIRLMNAMDRAYLEERRDGDKS